MDDTKQRLEQLLAQLETERDELRVKLGLAKLEARDELAELEGKLDTLRGRLKVLGAEAKAAGGDVAAAADVLADEIKAGFTRLRNLM
jgi:chromosome segregation ATPase